MGVLSRSGPRLADPFDGVKDRSGSSEPEGFDRTRPIANAVESDEGHLMIRPSAFLLIVATGLAGCQALPNRPQEALPDSSVAPIGQPSNLSEASGRNASLEEFIGVVRIFEFASFHSAGGEVFSVRVEGAEAQRRLAGEIRVHDKSEPLCLRVAFSGRRLAERDFVRRPIVAIENLRLLEATDCQ
jgi:hypothetical protein